MGTRMTLEQMEAEIDRILYELSEVDFDLRRFIWRQEHPEDSVLVNENDVQAVIDVLFFARADQTIWFSKWHGKL